MNKEGKRMQVPYLTMNEIQKMRLEDLDNFDLEFNKWLSAVTHLKREQRMKLTKIQYKKLLLETLNRECLLIH